MRRWSVRAYTPDDLRAVHEINQSQVPMVGSESIAALERIAELAVVNLVATVGEQVAGFALVLPPGTDYESDNYAWFGERFADFVYLDRVAILPEFQRVGIGRGLYDEIARLAPQVRPGATDWLLEVNLRPRNDRSLAFHAAMGFVEVGQHESRAGYRVAMMARPLVSG